MNTLTVSKKRDRPQLTICPPDLEPAGFEVGDKVHVQQGNGYVVITAAEADVGAAALGSSKIDATEPAVRSEMEARIIGNRLWQQGERLEDAGHPHVASETKQFARRFHRLAKTREDLAAADPAGLTGKQEASADV